VLAYHNNTEIKLETDLDLRQRSVDGLRSSLQSLPAQSKLLIRHSWEEPNSHSKAN